MDTLPFMLAVVALLATPGPTNNLLFAAGGSGGAVASLRLLAAELAGYVIGITLLHRLLLPLLPPLALTLFKVAAILLLLRIALQLWRRGDGEPGRGAVRFAQVFQTTLVNPKILILATVIFPPDGLARAMLVFAPVCVAVGLGWLLLGQALLSRAALPTATICKGCAMVQVIFAAVATAALAAPA